jgi:hypothetical protein
LGRALLLGDENEDDMSDEGRAMLSDEELLVPWSGSESSGSSSDDDKEAEEKDVERSLDMDIERMSHVVMALPHSVDLFRLVNSDPASGLPLSMCTFLMGVLEHITLLGDFLFGGTLVCNTWLMGRPAKRLRRLSHAERREKMTTFKDVMQAQLGVILRQLNDKDPEKHCTWTVLLQITDPLTQVEDLNEARANRHMCVLVVDHDRAPTLFDPLGRASGLHVVTRAIGEVAATLCNAERHIMYERQVQQVNKPTAVQWCVWYAFHCAAGTPDDHLLEVTSEDRRDKELEEFLQMLRVHSIALLVVVSREFCLID